MSKLTKRITAMLLAGMLVIGSVPSSVFAASTDVDPGQTSEIAEEVYEEESSEAPAGEGETTQVEDTSEAPVGAGKTTEIEETSEEPAAMGEMAGSGDTSEGPSAEEEAAVQYYTVTLDANGGYFENEWDDAVGDYVERAEVIGKQIPVGGTVAAFPVNINPDDQTMVFAGWSLERDGELVSQAEEEYIPVDNCVLYAVWQVADAALGENAEQELADENNEQTDAVQDSEEVDAVAGDTVVEEEGPVEEYIAFEANIDPKTENEQVTVPNQEAIYVDEGAENTSEESSEGAVEEEETQPSLIESSEEVETVSEDAAKDVVASGECGANGPNLIWTLDDEGTLIISGTGEMKDYNSSPFVFSDMVKTAIIESGVTSIGNFAFYRCSSLTSVTIPNSITSIGNSAFDDCSNLTSVTIPNSVTSIGSHAFYYCISLTSVTIPNSVTSIGDLAFYYCSSLTSVTIPNSVTSIGVHAFHYCKRLNSFIVESGNLYYSSENGVLFNKDQTVIISCLYSKSGDYQIPNSVTSIGDFAFSDCHNLTSITIPDGVISIGHHAFSGCSTLTSIDIPDSVTSIGESAFLSCSNLTSIDNSDSVTSIGDSAFCYCYHLTSIEIPEGVTSIGSFAFSRCESLTSITIPGSVISIGDFAFSDCSSARRSTIFFKGNAPTIASNAFNYVTATAYYPSNDPTWTSSVMQNYGGTITWEEEESTPTIHTESGTCGPNLTWTVEIEVGILTISGTGKMNDYEATGTRAPWSSYSINKVIIEEGVTGIGNNAFSGCPELTRIHFNGNAPSISSNAFTNVTAIAYYPNNDSSWTEDVRKNYGGNITWEMWDPEIGSEPGHESNIKAMFPANNAVDVDHALFTGQSFRLVFNKPFIVTKKCTIYLYESTKPTYVEKLEFDENYSSNVNQSSSDSNHLNVLTFWFSYQLKPGHTYQIEIDGYGIVFGRYYPNENIVIPTGEKLGEIKKEEWTFNTCKTDYMHFSNPNNVIDKTIYRILYKPWYADKIQKEDSGEKGACYGWAHMVGAKAQNYNNINRFGDYLANASLITRFGATNYTILQYLQMAHLYQYCTAKCKEKNKNKNKYKDIYDAICNHINGTGLKIIIGVHEGDDGHALYPLNIESDTESCITIRVLDCNRLLHTYNYCEDDTVKLRSFYSTLTMIKKDGEIVGFQYPELSERITFSTIDQTLDTAFGMSGKKLEASNMVFSSNRLNSSSLIEIDPVKEMEEDDTSEYLYWTDEDNIVQTIPLNTNIGITDGYTSIEATVDSDATINLDTTDNVAHIEPVSEETTSYTLVYGNADEDGNIDEITISSEADKGGVETQQTEDGIIISSEGNNHVEVSDGDNTVGFETNDASVLVKTDGAITVYEDSNNDGSYTNAVEVTPIGKTKINDNNTTINYSNDLTFNGNEIKAVDTVAYGNISLFEGTDYTITYTNNINAGTATVTITGIGDYEGTVTKTFTINPAAIDTAEISDIEPVTYNGEEQTPAPIVKVGDQTLTKDTDYTVSYANNTNIGTATVTITGKGNYTGTISKTFTISAAAIANATVSGISNKTYTGSALTQNPTVKFGEQTLTKDTDYTISYANNTKVGTATVKITGKGNYTGTVRKTFKINGIPVSNATVSGISNKTYTGSAQTQNPTVKVGDQTLKKDTDYTVSYANNTKVGTATVTITGKGNYASKKNVTFKINKAAQFITAKTGASRVAVGKTTTVSITGNKGKKSYKSSNTAIATVTSAGKVTAKKVGTVKITATSAATANYKAASKTVTIKVVPAATASLAAANQVKGIKLTWKKVTGANGYKVYRGSTLIKTITSGSTVTFTDTRANTNGTKYTYKVLAKATTGDSTLSKSRVIYRVSRPAISSVANSAASKMTVKWGKNAKANGYQIQYSTDKTFKSGNKAVSITSASTVSRVIGSLTKGKTYYVRIRTYKTVGSTKYWSIWSAARSVKISK